MREIDTRRDRTNMQQQPSQLQHRHHFIQQISQHQIKKKRQEFLIYTVHQTHSTCNTYTHTLYITFYTTVIASMNRIRNAQTWKMCKMWEREKKKERHIPCIVSGFIFATNEEYGMERKKATTFQKNRKNLIRCVESGDSTQSMMRKMPRKMI